MSDSNTAPAKPRKGPLSFLSGSVTSLVLAWFSFGLSKKVVVYLDALVEFQQHHCSEHCFSNEDAVHRDVFSGHFQLRLYRSRLVPGVSSQSFHERHGGRCLASAQSLCSHDPHDLGQLVLLLSPGLLLSVLLLATFAAGG